MKSPLLSFSVKFPEMDFLDSFDHFVFDLDGVVYAGDKPLADSPRVLETLRGNGKNVRFITNNPSRSPSDCARKLAGMGIEARAEEFATSPMATALLIEDRLRAKKWKTAFVAGSPHLKEQVKKTGLVETSGEDSLRADVVVMGSHPGFGMRELKTACLAIGGGAGFIGTNGDRFYPAENGRAPATGAILAAVEAATGKKAALAGKPLGYMFDLLWKSGIARGERTLVVGDGLATDIAGGKNAGCPTALVMTGVTLEKDLENPPAKPDFVLGDISFLLR